MGGNVCCCSRKTKEEETKREVIKSANRGQTLEEEQLRHLVRSARLDDHTISLEEDFKRHVVKNDMDVEDLEYFREIVLQQGPWERGTAKEQLSFLFHLFDNYVLVPLVLYDFSQRSSRGLLFTEVVDMFKWIHHWKDLNLTTDQLTTTAEKFARKMFTDIKKDIESDRVTKEEFVKWASNHDDIAAVMTRKVRSREARGGGNESL